MYKEFYNLQKEPFSLSPDPTFLYASEAHKEALAHMRYGIIQHRGFVLITGEVGTGKTTLLNLIIQELSENDKVAVISNPYLSPQDFLIMLAEEFKIGPVQNKAEFLIKFKKFLEDAKKTDSNVVLIVDEAHGLSHEIFEEIRMLSNIETPSSKLINIILVGQPELIDKLNQEENRPLKQRITLRYSLRPLDFQETSDYIMCRLQIAGAKDVGIFEPSAIKAIYKYSKGIPRLINIIADHALVTGFVNEIKYINEKIIKECVKELNLEGPELSGVSKALPKRRHDQKEYVSPKFLLIVVTLALLFLLGFEIFIGNISFDWLTNIFTSSKGGSG